MWLRAIRRRKKFRALPSDQPIDAYGKSCKEKEGGLFCRALGARKVGAFKEEGKANERKERSGVSRNWKSGSLCGTKKVSCLSIRGGGGVLKERLQGSAHGGGRQPHHANRRSRAYTKFLRARSEKRVRVEKRVKGTLD